MRSRLVIGGRPGTEVWRDDHFARHALAVSSFAGVIENQTLDANVRRCNTGDARGQPGRRCRAQYYISFTNVGTTEYLTACIIVKVVRVSRGVSFLLIAYSPINSFAMQLESDERA